MAKNPYDIYATEKIAWKVFAVMVISAFIGLFLYGDFSSTTELVGYILIIVVAYGGVGLVFWHMIRHEKAKLSQKP